MVTQEMKSLKDSFLGAARAVVTTAPLDQDAKVLLLNEYTNAFDGNTLSLCVSSHVWLGVINAESFKQRSFAQGQRATLKTQARQAKRRRRGDGGGRGRGGGRY